MHSSSLRSVVVTGASSGLGLEVARLLARERFRVTLACRDRERGERARGDIVASAGAAFDDVRLAALDVSDLDSVRRFAASASDMDALVCNAAVQILGRVRRNDDGIEETFATNHLGHFLLARLMLPAMRDGAKIVFVSSNTHDPKRWTGMPAPSVDDLAGLATGASFGDEPPAVAGRRRYTTSKLCNVLCAYELARRLGAPSPTSPAIRVYAFDPGLMPGTGLGREYGPAARWAWRNLVPIAAGALPNVNTVETSARRLVALVTGAAEATSGEYVSCGRVTRSSKASYDEDLARRLWELSSRLAGVSPDLRDDARLGSGIAGAGRP
jgi:NAD(P)-dependent dehydrogenase (short-subunit alcohol dehydrogenase family)